jgi:hypothetical protein
MRAILPYFLVILLAAGYCHARTTSEPILTRQAVLPGEFESDFPRSTVSLRADTVWYGDYEIIDGTYYARSSTNRGDVLWTVDRGNGPFGDPDRLENGAEWKAVDPRRALESYVRVIDGTLDLGEGVAAPILSGERSLWVGISGPEADSLCYDCGAGYGNHWLQRITSEPLPYNGIGDVSLSFLCFNDSEDCYDGTQVYLRRADETRLLLNPYPPGECENNTSYEGGTLTGSIGSPEYPETYTRVITAAEIDGAQEIRIEIEFFSDRIWSDEDCLYPTTYGPIAIDDLAIQGGGRMDPVGRAGASTRDQHYRYRLLRVLRHLQLCSRSEHPRVSPRSLRRRHLLERDSPSRRKSDLHHRLPRLERLLSGVRRLHPFPPRLYAHPGPVVVLPLDLSRHR